MARQSRDWRLGLAEDLRSPSFAREFLMCSVNEGTNVQLVLRTVIRTIGVKEFSAKVGMARPSVVRAIRPSCTPSLQTLNRLLKPFRLRVTLAPLGGRRRRPAA